LSGSILRIEHHVLRVADKQPHYSQLLSVPGIGKILAMTSVLEAAEISRFPSPEDFASYCRTVAAIKTSNGKKKADNNRKCGNRYLGWAFIEAANLIRRYDLRAPLACASWPRATRSSPLKCWLANWPRPSDTS
jgi:transposase